MIIIKILLGLIGIGVVIFVHELGHFLAARLVGIDVEAFSLGWGKAILKKKIGSVEYRIGLFPLGGYCKMSGENEFQQAYENKRDSVEPVKGTFFSVSPVRRIIVSFAGPFFNLIFAVIALSLVWGAGITVNTVENKIVLASSIDPDAQYPADSAQLLTGDRIVEIAGKPIATYLDIQETIVLNPEKELPLKVERNGEIHSLKVKPELDKSTGSGKIGVYYWAEPVVSEVVPESPAALAGLEPEDRILKINGQDFPYTVALIPIMRERPPVLSVEFERNGQTQTTDIVPWYSDSGDATIGLGYKTLHYRTPSLNPIQALRTGASKAWETFAVSVKSLSLLFRGIDLTQAISGPMRITMMVGEIATESFGQSIGTGFSTLANFLSLISISLCIMNLLPLPILDGGMIVLFLIEAIQRKPLHPRFIITFQIVGVVLIFGFMAFAFFGDILYFVRS
ncbi:MAG: site-2 protease family protein [Spirochaetaceae bacterium]|jgi:regulator of sigma E protease|nr:site-2 protease family protein [Spirochaetaceae bacterium]